MKQEHKLALVTVILLAIGFTLLHILSNTIYIPSVWDYLLIPTGIFVLFCLIFGAIGSVVLIVRWIVD
jgi:hypothetical protein